MEWHTGEAAAGQQPAAQAAPQRNMRQRPEACVGLTCTPGSEPPPDEYLEGALVTADSCTANLDRPHSTTHTQQQHQ